MKRIIILIMTVILSISILGCRQETPVIQKPVQLYYRTVTPENGIQDSVINTVTVEGFGKLDNLQSLLNEYLRGTSEEGFETTFPASTKLLDMTVADGVAYLHMNASLARLTGIDLTIACACITLTTMELTGAAQVHIQAANTTLDGAETIVMNKACLTLLDLYTPEST